jgi:protocatechuate 3,4-dioxygenase, beta subunit
MSSIYDSHADSPSSKRQVRPTRRTFLLAAAMVGAGATVPFLGSRAHALTPTPRSTEGPFYPRRLPADIDNDLTRIGGKSGVAKGNLLVFGGRLLDTRGAPVTNARIEIWQCDVTGHYHHVGYDSRNIDEHFQGFGIANTDAEGRYQFRTIKPAAYPGRTAHIHYIVKTPRGVALTSQMLFEGEPGNENDFVFRAARDSNERERLLMKLSGGKELNGVMDIVIAA